MKDPRGFYTNLVKLFVDDMLRKGPELKCSVRAFTVVNGQKEVLGLGWFGLWEGGLG